MSILFCPFKAIGEQETDDPAVADRYGYYKLEQWTKDAQRVEWMVWAAERIEIAREKFAAAVKHRPRGHYTIRQGIRVLAKWPDDPTSAVENT